MTTVKVVATVVNADGTDGESVSSSFTFNTVSPNDADDAVLVAAATQAVALLTAALGAPPVNPPVVTAAVRGGFGSR